MTNKQSRSGRSGKTSKVGAVPISRTVSAIRLPAGGKDLAFEADARERARLAVFWGVESVEEFRADLHFAPWKEDGVLVTGIAQVNLTQLCVVSLEPFPARLQVPVDGLFVPAARAGGSDRLRAQEIVVDPQADDPPEEFDNGVIDAAMLAVESVTLELDPYPRKPDADLPDLAKSGPADGQTDSGRPNPFAVLADYKTDSHDKD